MGKRGAVRVIYAKGVNDNIPAHILRKLAEELGHDG